MLTKQPFKCIFSKPCLFLWRVPEFFDALTNKESDVCFYNIVIDSRIEYDKYWIGTCMSFSEICWTVFGISVLRMAQNIFAALRENESVQEEKQGLKQPGLHFKKLIPDSPAKFARRELCGIGFIITHSRW